MNRGVVTIVTVVLITSLVAAAAGAGAGAATGDARTHAENDAYAGAHVEFEVSGDAITDYRVGGERTFSSVRVQSQSESDAGLGANISLDAVANVEGAGLSLAAQSKTSAQVRSESGATLSAHDNERGILTVAAGGESQFVEAEVASDAQASGDGDRVFVETDGQSGVFLVVGDGEVTVNDEGNVVADLSGDATLAFRSYADGERDDEAERQENLIADGTAAAEVYVEHRDGEAVADAINYGEETSLEARQDAENRVEVTVDRTVEEGTIVLTTVSEEAVGSLENLEVTVDGEAAVEASSQSELEGAIGSDQSRYLVSQNANADARATVYVAVNHFSERTIGIDGADGDEDGGADDGSGADEGTDDTDGDGEGDEMPGFGVGVAVLALLGGLASRVRR